MRGARRRGCRLRACCSRSARRTDAPTPPSWVIARSRRSGSCWLCRGRPSSRRASSVRHRPHSTIKRRSSGPTRWRSKRSARITCRPSGWCRHWPRPLDRAARATMPRRFVDLSIFLENDVLSDPPSFKPKIQYFTHANTVEQIAGFFPGLRREDLPDGEGWAVEFVQLSTHNGTHLDAPYHFHSMMDNAIGAKKPAIAIHEVPLVWC